jgi:hypothetical protein
VVKGGQRNLGRARIERPRSAQPTLGTLARNGWPVRSVSSVQVHSAIRNAVSVVLSPPNAGAIVSRLIELLIPLSLRMP